SRAPRRGSSPGAPSASSARTIRQSLRGARARRTSARCRPAAGSTQNPHRRTTRSERWRPAPPERGALARRTRRVSPSFRDRQGAPWRISSSTRSSSSFLPFDEKRKLRFDQSVIGRNEQDQDGEEPSGHGGADRPVADADGRGVASAGKVPGGVLADEGRDHDGAGGGRTGLARAGADGGGRGGQDDAAKGLDPVGAADRPRVFEVGVALLQRGGE